MLKHNLRESRRWTQLGLLAVVELLAMALWFSASSMTPALVAAWNLSEGAAAWLTISVQVGFVVGALVSAIFNLPERFSPPAFMANCALWGAIFNFLIAQVVSDEMARGREGFGYVISFRFWTGVMLAGVYPVGMKVMASWFSRGRGLAIGVLVGALTVGSASPHLVNALPLDVWSERFFGGVAAWRVVMMIASASAALAAVIAGLFVRTGPHLPAAARFDWRYFASVWTQPALRRANFGYLGHMFELYAMWTWAPQLLLASYTAAGWGTAAARVAAFSTVAIGGLGCVVAGIAADRVGRCWTTIASLIVSGVCALVAGSLIEQPGLLTAVCLLWGFAVVADSAQFSAAISELCDPQFVGTALTIQTCAGFLLTTLTIRAVPALKQQVGWQGALALLALGPVFRIYHMARLWWMEEA
ncbi:MAG: MFS transporter, partial [Planctomycetia bacterium]|nr:MFS transporter [Planctomycetia bacterium]